MRITQSMLSNNMLNNISNSYERLGKLQEQITTQKKFSKPSDDPAAAMMGMTYRTNLNQVEQYSSNISEATSWTESTDSALNQAISALQRIRELAVQASNGTYEESQRGSIAEEIKELKQHIVDIGDTQLGEQYIFNGYNTNTRPSDTIIQERIQMQGHLAMALVKFKLKYLMGLRFRLIQVEKYLKMRLVIRDLLRNYIKH